ncbi:hypothetical protein [Flavobacterium aestuarii]|uniref:hypothetical protein n=1 Tax=Flavobacterium aestuarii TaxID=3149227 RepID=UPI0032B521B0
MKEIINSILDSTKERLKNPLLGSFIFSWFIFNWKPIFHIIFSNNSIENKIDFVSDCYSSINNNFWFPLLFSIFYIVIFPYVLWGFDKLSSKAIIGRKENVLNLTISDIRNKQKIAVEESDLENIKASYRDKADLNKKIEILTNQLNEKNEIIQMQNVEYNQIKKEENELKELIKNNSDSTLYKNDITDLNKQYNDFKQSDMFDFFEEIGPEISRRNSLPNKTNDLVIEKFKHSGIIKEERDAENQRNLYKFTTKGEYFWKQYVTNLRIRKIPKEEDDLPF